MVHYLPYYSLVHSARDLKMRLVLRHKAPTSYTYALTQQMNSWFDSDKHAMTLAIIVLKMKLTACMIAQKKFNDLNFCFDAIYQNYGEHGMTSYEIGKVVHMPSHQKSHPCELGFE